MRNHRQVLTGQMLMPAVQARMELRKDVIELVLATDMKQVSRTRGVASTVTDHLLKCMAAR